MIEFRKLLERARQEHRIVEETRKRVVSQAIERVDDLVETKTEELEDAPGEIHLTEQEIREFAAALNPRGTATEKINTLEIEAKQFRMGALKETNPARGAFYEGVSETAMLKADKIRLEIGLNMTR